MNQEEIVMKMNIRFGSDCSDSQPCRYQIISDTEGERVVSLFRANEVSESKKSQ